ncbi:MAG: ribosome maturation factor RimM [Proteobacteria bacterium]|nr:ribosome maturation factor RimM [Pseudomonadota bacterium]
MSAAKTPPIEPAAGAGGPIASAADGAGARTVALGRITGAFGVRGELRIESWTDPLDAIFRYQPWTLVRAPDTSRLAGVRGRCHGDAVVATIPGVSDRDAAQNWAGYEISVPRSALPPPRPGEYYWVDLEGLDVVNLEGLAFGKVDHLFDTGANHVMVVRGERERLLPFVQPHLVSVDFDSRRIVVDWDPEF